nr:TetR/AcrR family transcriptional regulator [uncultured Desulfuromonas sp.]
MPPIRKKRDALLKAALKLFAQKGIDTTTTALIAQKAGVANGTLFNYFSTKEDLVHALFFEVVEDIERNVFNTDQPQENPLERIHGFLTGLIRYLNKHHDIFKFLEQFRFSTYNKKSRTDVLKSSSTIRELLIVTRDQGYLHPLDIDTIEALVFGPITCAVKDSILNKQRISEKDSDVLVRHCLRSVARDDTMTL